jgi:hypothetical protein
MAALDFWRAALATLEEVPRRRLDMRGWGYRPLDNHCGTTCCIGGWMLLAGRLGDATAEWFETRAFPGRALLDIAGPHGFADAAAAVYGTSRDVTSSLFYEHAGANRATVRRYIRAQVARLEHAARARTIAALAAACEAAPAAERELADA